VGELARGVLLEKEEEEEQLPTAGELEAGCAAHGSGSWRRRWRRQLWLVWCARIDGAGRAVGGGGAVGNGEEDQLVTAGELEAGRAAQQQLEEEVEEAAVAGGRAGAGRTVGGRTGRSSSSWRRLGGAGRGIAVHLAGG
jgi:hypothetical protein